MQRSTLARVAAAAAFALAATAATACTAGPQPPTPSASPPSFSAVPEAARGVMSKPQYANGTWSVYAEDLKTGEVLVDLESETLLQPGSFVKTYSTAAAWLKWGPDSTISTPVKRTGAVVGGTLRGDLVLVGKGDLTMGGRTKPDGTVDFTNLDHNDANPLPGSTLTPENPLTGLDRLAGQVKAAGINAVSGDVVVDDRLFSGQLQGKPVTPIIINQNILDIMITPGSAGKPATAALTPAVAPWKLDLQVQTVAAGGKTAIANPVSADGRTITVTGTIAADSAPQLKIYEFGDPATFARTAFIEALGRAGVTVSADPIATNTTDRLAPQQAVDALPSVATLTSLPLEQEATYVMKISYNRGAQTFVCRLAVDAGSDDCDAGMPVAGEIWKAAGLDISAAMLIDGSGLEGNYITGENAAAVQRLMAKRPDSDRWRATLPVLGVDGSLADVQRDSPAAGKVFAKTGTLLGIDLFSDPMRFRLATKTLGGVMEAASGRMLAFTIIVNQGVYPTQSGVLEANDDVGAVAAAVQQAY